MSAVRIPRAKLQTIIETLQRYGSPIAREDLNTILEAIADAPLDGDDVVAHLTDNQRKFAASHIAVAADGWLKKLSMIFYEVEPTDELLDGHLSEAPKP